MMKVTISACTESEKVNVISKPEFKFYEGTLQDTSISLSTLLFKLL